MFSKEPLEVSVDNIPSIISDIDSKGEKEKIRFSREAVHAEVNELKDIFKQLSSKTVNDNYVNVLKDRFCEKNMKLILNLPEVHDDFIISVKTAVDEISGISLKEFRHFQAFKEDMSKVAFRIKLVQEKLEDFQKFYLQSKYKKIADLNGLSKAVNSKQSEIQRLVTEIEAVEKAIPFIKDALESDERKLSEVSAKFSSIESETRDTALMLESEKSIIKQRIGTELGSLDKIFKKIEHEDPKKYAFLRPYIIDAANAFISDETLEIRTFLEEIRETVKAEDPEKYDKLLDVIRNIDFFDSLRQQYKGLEAKLNEIRESNLQELQPLEKEKNHLGLSIEEKRNELNQLLDKRNAKFAEKEKLVQEISVQRVDIAEALKDLMQREVRLV